MDNTYNVEDAVKSIQAASAAKLLDSLASDPMFYAHVVDIEEDDVDYLHLVTCINQTIVALELYAAEVTGGMDANYAQERYNRVFTERGIRPPDVHLYPENNPQMTYPRQEV